MESFAVPDNLSGEEYIFMAKTAGKASRFFEMAKFVDKVVERAKAAGTDLTPDERKVFAASYDKVHKLLLSSWKVANRIVRESEGRGDNRERCKLARDYRSQVESEVKDVTGRLLKALDEHLLSSFSSLMARLTYLLMKADCHYVLAHSVRRSCGDIAMAFYMCAQDTGALFLPPCHPARLRVAISICQLHSEIMTEITQGYTVAKEAFEEALPELDSVSAESYEESRLWMRYLRASLIKCRPDEQVRELPPRRL